MITGNGQQKFHDENIHLSQVSSLYSDFVRQAVDKCAFDYLQDISEKKVLDYGCGAGELSLKLARRDAIVFGFDISYERLALANKHMKQQNIDTRFAFFKMNAYALGFKDGSFDFVVGRGILHHLNIERVADEIKRVLKPGGRAIFIEPLGMNPVINAYRKLTPGFRVPDERPLNFSDIHKIGSLFSAYSYEEFYFSTFFAHIVKLILRNEHVFLKTFLLLRSLDELIKGALPFMTRYYWQTVICLEK